ncbi:hypothetical protein A8E35_03360 [Burkholderia cenocepacia]|nr:hypothetical protein A8E35_03360 [Burkholderia cenocepacia]
MADSTTNIDQISSTQANKELTMNSLTDAASPAMLWGASRERIDRHDVGVLRRPLCGQYRHRACDRERIDHARS